MIPNHCFFTCAHAVIVPYQAKPVKATASMTAQKCSSLAQSARPVSPAHMRGIADVVVWSLHRSLKARNAFSGKNLLKTDRDLTRLGAH
jgi:hypothetical protein